MYLDAKSGAWPLFHFGALSQPCSTGLIDHGTDTLFQLRDKIHARQMATVIAGAGLFMWLILMQIVLIH